MKDTSSENIFPHKSSDASDVISKYSSYGEWFETRDSNISSRLPRKKLRCNCSWKSALLQRRHLHLVLFRLSALSRSSRPVLDFFKPSQIKMVWDAAFLTPSCESSSPHLAQKSRNTIAEQTKYSYMIRYMLGKLTTPGWTQPNSSCKLEPQVLKLVLAKYLACTQRSSASSCLLFNRSVFHCWSSSTDPWPQQRGTTFKTPMHTLKCLRSTSGKANLWHQLSMYKKNYNLVLLGSLKDFLEKNHQVVPKQLEKGSEGGKA